MSDRVKLFVIDTGPLITLDGRRITKSTIGRFCSERVGHVPGQTKRPALAGLLRWSDRRFAAAIVRRGGASKKSLTRNVVSQPPVRDFIHSFTFLVNAGCPMIADRCQAPQQGTF
jgi:hypothetical protein